MATEQPITERINDLSVNIDVASPSEMLTILQQCDEEIFDGWKDYPGMSDRNIQTTVSAIADVAADILKIGQEGAIVFSGCGTSGRLGFISARSFNLKFVAEGYQPIFHYIMAGGDRALFTSQEAVEDDPPFGAELLSNLCHDKSRVLFIGITCGLSAPFVAGQLHLCMENARKYTPVLLGFNPARQARNLPIDKWDKTFLQVVERFEKHENAFILNPVVGPEPITGSSRMKSGSATKILLELIFILALQKLQQRPAVSVKSLLECYRLTCRSVYQHKIDIARVLNLAGNSLERGGHIYYLSQDSLGIMGMIDASECPPTYGATLDDVRGFVATGFDYLRNNEGDISGTGKHFRIALSHFQEDVVPTLTENDTVIALCQGTNDVLDITKVKCRTVCVNIFAQTTERDAKQFQHFDAVVNVDIPSSEMSNLVTSSLVSEWSLLFREIAVKWVLNAVTTGAHILKGKVYQNMMIDLKVSNNKLFHRSVGIIQKFSKLSRDEALEYLLRSIYSTDTVTPDIRTAPVAQHVQRATPLAKVVPVALMAALRKCPLIQARALVDEQPIISKTIISSLQHTVSR